MIVDLLDAARAITYALIGWCFIGGLLFTLGVLAIRYAVTAVWPRLRR